ncbi:MAG: L,D-transpeptidase family protein [Epsilonproteobacteria bacterium]|nr:L,D-transpeptidase family protein [Campylobacterota bacterium]
MDNLKNILFIIVAIMLAVAIEAMTVNSAQEVKNLNRDLKSLKVDDSSREKLSLSDALFVQNSQIGLVNLIFDDENRTFKYISNREFIKSIYSKLNFTPLWFNRDGLKRELVDELFSVIESDEILDRRGNIYKRYRYLKRVLDRNMSMEQMLKRDIMITSLYKSYLNFHIFGSIKWWSFQKYLKGLRDNRISARWITYNPKFDIEDLILNHKPRDVVDMTTPKTFGYGQMLIELKRLKDIRSRGGFVKVPNSRQLRYGRSGDSVAKLKKRLTQSGDYICSGGEGRKRYGKCLKRAVKRFQKRHGLSQSGKIDRETLRELNLSIDRRIDKLLLNMDRIKRLPRGLSRRYLMVNIPSFRLYYFDDMVERFSMRVIVGDKRHHTPIFSNSVSFIVLNPYWIIPDSIVRKEIIPRMLKNPNYAKERGYEVRLSYNVNAPQVDTKKVNWDRVLKSGESKKYKFVQPPGPKNALGKIKFKFPNQFSVYLHDTSDRGLFKREKRAFSHGCIRVSEPYKLLKSFTEHEDKVSYSRCKTILDGDRKSQINLDNRVPIYIVYLTAWVDSKGLLYYFDDIYNYDKHQKRAIQ